MMQGKRIFMVRAVFLFIGVFLSAPGVLRTCYAGIHEPTLTKQEKAIFDQIRQLRDLSDEHRARTTKQLALDIRRLTGAPHRLDLAFALAGLSTEGDLGHDTLQEVATTLAEALRCSYGGAPNLVYLLLLPPRAPPVAFRTQSLHFRHRQPPTLGPACPRFP